MWHLVKRTRWGLPQANPQSISIVPTNAVTKNFTKFWRFTSCYKRSCWFYMVLRPCLFSNQPICDRHCEWFSTHTYESSHLVLQFYLKNWGVNSILICYMKNASKTSQIYFRLEPIISRALKTNWIGLQRTRHCVIIWMKAKISHHHAQFTVVILTYHWIVNEYVLIWLYWLMIMSRGGDHEPEGSVEG